MSFIYSDIIQTYGKKIARKCGYFNTGKDFELLVPYYSDIYDSLFDTLWKYFEKPTINSLTTFMYYPGAFTHFHEGHLDVVKQAYNFISQRTDNFYIVLSPANSDYIKYKYPDLNITNKSRYDLILESLQTLDKISLSKIIIDLNPMLNMDRDYNFTDLLNNFVTIYGACYHKGPHYVICGKDKNFKILEQYTDKIKIFYGEMKIEKHSKDLIKAQPFQKKNCILRFNEVKELTLFKKYFKDYYNFILPNQIEFEKDSFDLINTNKNIITICKDYQKEFPYFRVSRNWNNPLEQNGYINQIEGYDPAYTLVIDSDCYTGGTLLYLESLGYEVKIAGKGYEQYLPKDYDIVDFTDFYNIENCYYPYKDSSERMSLPSFDSNMHKHFQQFLKEVEQL